MEAQNKEARTISEKAPNTCPYCGRTVLVKDKPCFVCRKKFEEENKTPKRGSGKFLFYSFIGVLVIILGIILINDVSRPKHNSTSDMEVAPLVENNNYEGLYNFMHRYIGWPYYAKEVGVALMKLSERPEYKSRVDDGILNYFDLSGQMVDEIIKVYPQTSFSPFKSLNELIDLYLQHPSNWYLYYSFIKLDYKNFAYPTIIMKMFYLLQNPKDYYKIDRLAELGINLGLDLDHKLSDIRNCYWDYKKLSDEWSKVHKPIKPADNYGIEYKGVIKFHGRYFGMLQQNVIAESDSKYFWLNGLHFVHNEFINEYVERTGQVVEFRYGRKSKTAEVLRLSDEQTYLDDIEEYQRQLKEAGQQYANTKAEFNRQMAEYENSKPYYESRLQELLGRFNNLVTELYSQI